MTEIPESLRTLFTGRLERRGDRYVVTVPRRAVDAGDVSPGETYRVALLAQSGTDETESRDPRPAANEGDDGPPVDEGEVREVTVESVGDKGDGIAKVEHGYVVIVPGARPGDSPTVRIDTVRQNVAFATVLDEA
jgi:predicted RNA-binding protein with TRAM domain